MRQWLIPGAALIALLPVAASAGAPASPTGGAPEVTKAVRQIHDRILTLDTHLDTPASLALPGWSITERHVLRLLAETEAKSTR